MAPAGASLLHVALFQFVWLACVLGAADGHGWLGPAAAVPFLAWVLWTSTARAAEGRLIAGAALLGLLLDSLLTASGALRFAAPGPLPGLLAPVWIVALWASFATLAPRALSWLQGRWLLAAALGAAAGPLTYLGAARLGAASLLLPTWQAALAVGLEYGLAMPVLVRLARAATPQADAPA